MGFWVDFRSTIAKLINRNAPDIQPVTDACRSSYDLSLAAVSKIGNGVIDGTQKLKEPVTDACRSSYDLGLAAVTKIGNGVIDGTQKLKEYSSDPDRREKIGRIMTNVGKFAVESAINDSLKTVTGGIQVYKIVQEGLKDQPPSLSSNDKKKPEDLTVGMEEMQAKMEKMQAKMEKMQEEINYIKQQNKISTECVEGSEPLKKISTEPIKESDLLKTDRKRVMIRSRL